MVVSMKGPRASQGDHNFSGASPSSSTAGQFQPVFGTTPSQAESETRAGVDIPFYHTNQADPVSSLVKHLCELFFTHLGCNYPFLQRDRFLRDLDEKRVDAILVDAVCALGARFSNHPLLTTPNDQSVEVDENNQVQRAFRGHPFTQRAMSAVIDTFAYPTAAVVQACLLLAYDEFGSNHDSGLWMYLGLSIRMAQDIGMHKLEGLRLEGRIGPTPKTAKRGSAGSSEESEREEEQKSLTQQEEEQLRKEMRSGGDQEIVTIEDRRANERERIDTFYAVFFLDRVVSSGTGRPVTLRDKDIEISFPFRSDDESIRGWPAPFPPLIRIIHLYGRAADVLNGIKEVQQVTSETLKKLAGLEKDLTGIYQGLSPKLHFNAVNFQHYVKAEQGTNFILLHFWFHTLIVLLHQPTLFHSFGGNIQELLQLFPDSRELSMSSAKTIADILAFAELIDAKSFIGNPFTTQPIYIAACAFLAEIAHYSSSPSSRDVTPPAQRGERTTSSRPDKRAAKYTLLTAAANQNYQQCYKALKSLENYWAGARYILTALDQKSKGIMDPLLYTVEDVESAIEVPRQYPAFSTPGWRQSIAHNHSLSYPNMAARGRHGSNGAKDPLSPTANPIGWSLTGTMNSPNPNLSVLYSAPYAEPLAAMDFSTSQVPDMSHHRPGGAFQASPQTSKRLLTHASAGIPNSNMPSQTRFPTKQHYHNERMSDADLLLSLNSPAATSTSLGSGPSPNPNNPLNFPPTSQFTSSPSLPNMPPPLHDPLNTNPSSSFNHLSLTPNINYPNSTTSHLFNDATVMTIQSQDIDVNAPQNGFAFPNGETIPWLEYLPEDILSYFNDPSSHDGQQDQQQGQMVNNQQGTGADGAGTT